jgi:hypothetical protein
MTLTEKYMKDNGIQIVRVSPRRWQIGVYDPDNEELRLTTEKYASYDKAYSVLQRMRIWQLTSPSNLIALDGLEKSS